MGRGRRSRGPRPRTRSCRSRCARSTPSCSPRCRHRRTSPTATSTCPRSGPDYLRPGHTVLDGEVVEHRRPACRVRRGRPGQPDADAVRARRGGVRRQGRGARRGRRALRAHPARAARSSATTSSPGASSSAAARSSSTSARPSPRLVLFGHVHQPLVRRARIGRTECVNVGHFRGGRTPFSLLVVRPRSGRLDPIPVVGPRHGRSHRVEHRHRRRARRGHGRDRGHLQLPRVERRREVASRSSPSTRTGDPADARFVVDAGAIKDTYELEYDWTDDDRRSRGSSRRARC